jgi:nucleoid-associated protein YgaU
MASFEELKAKYQPVLTVVQSKQVQMANLHMQDGKLFMKGTAPSQEAANAVWDAIKRINPKLDDVIADFPIDTNMKSAMSGMSGMSGESGSNARMYKVKPGDTLSKISQQFFGNPNQYQKIFEANRDKLTDPNKIQVGQELKIPAA